MQDRESGTYWSQASGKAIAGPMEGSELQMLPSVTTTWAVWRDKHPDTVVLKKTFRDPRRSNYSDYYEDEDRLGIFGTKNADSRLSGKTRVFGLSSGDDSVAIPVQELRERGFVQVSLDSVPALVLPIEGDMSARAYHRQVGSDVLTFSQNGDQLIDEQTESIWNADTMEAIDGKLKGKQLTQLTGHPAFWFVWSRFHPETRIVPAP